MMFQKSIIYTLLLMFTAAVLASAQNLDGSPYRPGVDADIDLYLCSWKESMPVKSHGFLVERDIFTRGDPLKPPAKGKVLKYMNRFTYAELSAGALTKPATLAGEQELFYILTGRGVIKTAKTTANLYPGVAVLVPCRVRVHTGQHGHGERPHHVSGQ